MEGDVGDGAARVVEGQVRVEGVGKDTESRVGDEEKDEDETGESEDLDKVALLAVNVSSGSVQRRGSTEPLTMRLVIAAMCRRWPSSST